MADPDVPYEEAVAAAAEAARAGGGEEGEEELEPRPLRDPRKVRPVLVGRWRCRPSWGWGNEGGACGRTGARPSSYRLPRPSTPTPLYATRCLCGATSSPSSERTAQRSAAQHGTARRSTAQHAPPATTHRCPRTSPSPTPPPLTSPPLPSPHLPIAPQPAPGPGAGGRPEPAQGAHNTTQQRGPPRPPHLHAPAAQTQHAQAAQAQHAPAAQAQHAPAARITTSQRPPFRSCLTPPPRPPLPALPRTAWTSAARRCCVWTRGGWC